MDAQPEVRTRAWQDADARPGRIVWLVEQLAEWERENETRRTKRLQEPNRELVRRRYEEEFDRRLDLARRQSQQ